MHVGYGTFEPIRGDDVESHKLAAEPFEITPATARTLNAALDDGRRIVAVGTTTTRVLEAAARRGVGPARGRLGLDRPLHLPGLRLPRRRCALFTNFHLPRSSLIVLASAFAGREPLLATYAEAVARRYRFYSYGDAMLIV